MRNSVAASSKVAQMASIFQSSGGSDTNQVSATPTPSVMSYSAGTELVTMFSSFLWRVAVLYTVFWVVHWLIKKKRNNSKVFLECVDPLFLTDSSSCFGKKFLR